MKKISPLAILFILFSFIQADSQNPHWVWARSAHFSSSIGVGGIGRSVSADRSENVYFTGWVSNTFSISFGAYTLTGGGPYLVKYDSSGTVLWAKSSSGIGALGARAY